MCVCDASKAIINAPLAFFCPVSHFSSFIHIIFVVVAVAIFFLNLIVLLYAHFCLYLKSFFHYSLRVIIKSPTQILRREKYFHLYMCVFVPHTKATTPFIDSFHTFIPDHLSRMHSTLKSKKMARTEKEEVPL